MGRCVIAGVIIQQMQGMSMDGVRLRRILFIFLLLHASVCLSSCFCSFSANSTLTIKTQYQERVPNNSFRRGWPRWSWAKSDEKTPYKFPVQFSISLPVLSAIPVPRSWIFFFPPNWLLSRPRSGSIHRREPRRNGAKNTRTHKLHFPIHPHRDYYRQMDEENKDPMITNLTRSRPRQ